jgi:hypothetical protein
MLITVMMGSRNKFGMTGVSCFVRPFLYMTPADKLWTNLTKRHWFTAPSPSVIANDSVAILDYVSQLCLSLRPVQSGIATSFLLAMTLSNELVVCPSAFQTGTCGQSPDKPIPPLH